MLLVRQATHFLADASLPVIRKLGGQNLIVSVAYVIDQVHIPCCHFDYIQPGTFAIDLIDPTTYVRRISAFRIHANRPPDCHNPRFPSRTTHRPRRFVRERLKLHSRGEQESSPHSQTAAPSLSSPPLSQKLPTTGPLSLATGFVVGR